MCNKWFSFHFPPHLINQQEGYLWSSHKRDGRALSCPAGSWAAAVLEALCCWPTVSLWPLLCHGRLLLSPCDPLKEVQDEHFRSSGMLSKLVTFKSLFWSSFHLLQARWVESVHVLPEIIKGELLERHNGNFLCAELLLLRQHRHHWLSSRWGQIQQILEDRNYSLQFYSCQT